METFPSWPSYTQNEINAVKNVLNSNLVNYWTGNKCKTFEEAFAKKINCNYAISLTNGTAALELALRACGIGNGHEVIVTARTFIASISAIVAVGAKPIFADVDLNTQNITIDTIKPVITDATRAIICVHLAGWPCDMNPILKIANEKNFFVIEDCAQAHGAEYFGKSVGSLGDVAAWSFCQDKIMTTGGEGGMLTTNNYSIWKKAWSYKDHGKSYELSNTPPKNFEFKWLHHDLGSNYRMTEMQAAIGLQQLQYLDQWLSKRTENAHEILNACQLNGLRVSIPDDAFKHAWYKCYAFIDLTKLKPGWSRQKIIQNINKLGIPCYEGICPEVYLEVAMQDRGLAPKERLTNAKKLGETSLMFLVHPTLGKSYHLAFKKVISTVMSEVY